MCFYQSIQKLNFYIFQDQNNECCHKQKPRGNKKTLGNKSICNSFLSHLSVCYVKTEMDNKDICTLFSKVK